MGAHGVGGIRMGGDPHQLYLQVLHTVTLLELLPGLLRHIAILSGLQREGPVSI